MCEHGATSARRSHAAVSAAAGTWPIAVARWHLGVLAMLLHERFLVLRDVGANCALQLCSVERSGGDERGE